MSMIYGIQTRQTPFLICAGCLSGWYGPANLFGHGPMRSGPRPSPLRTANPQKQDNRLRAAVALARLVNRNPYLDALTTESLHATKPLLTYDYQDTLHKIV